MGRAKNSHGFGSPVAGLLCVRGKRFAAAIISSRGMGSIGFYY
jgi:hypothetical protein